MLAILTPESVTAQGSLAETLKRLLDFQLSHGVTQRQKMAVWFAYYGEASARPIYQKICSSSDRLSMQKVEELFAAIISEGQYQERDPRQLATGYLALIDGLWLSLLVAPRVLTKARGKDVARAYLQQAFPGHLN